MAKRTFAEIARDIREEWKNISPYAKEYLDALLWCDTTDKNASYFMDSVGSVALYFLSSASTFRGPRARELKAEMRALLA